MNDIFEISPTDINPHVIMNANTGEFIFEGRSLVEYPADFYKDVMDWIKQKESSFSFETLKLTIDMDYVNTSSSGVFATILKQIVQLKESLEVTWKYETDDLDCFELGESYSKLLDIKFDFVEY